MRILLVHNYYQYYGGEDTYFESLAKLLKEKGHEVIVYTRDSKNLKTFWDKVRVAVGMFWSFQVDKELSEIIKKHRPEIVQFQNIYPIITPTAYMVCGKFNIPIIQRVSNHRLVCPNGLLFRNGKMCELCARKIFKYPAILFGCYHDSRMASLIFSVSLLWHNLIKSYKYIGAYIFPSKFVQEYCINIAQILPEKTVVIPTFSEELKTKEKIKTANYFLYVGRLSEEKGIVQLLDLFSKLPDLKLEELHLILCSLFLYIINNILFQLFNCRINNPICCSWVH